MSESIELGSKVKDTVSGYEGTAVARYIYLNGCERYEVAGADKDGKPEAFVFDVQQLVVTKGPVVSVTRVVGRKLVVDAPGGDRSSTPVAR